VKKFLPQFLRYIIGVLFSFDSSEWGIILVVSAQGVIVTTGNGNWKRTWLFEKSAFLDNFVEVVFFGLLVVGMDGGGSVETDFDVVLKLLDVVAFGAVIFGKVSGVSHCDAVALVAVGVGHFPADVQLFVHALQNLHFWMFFK
jgi:hypothetical protein